MKMLTKKLLIAISAIVLIAAFALISGCSNEEGPVQSLAEAQNAELRSVANPDISELEISNQITSESNQGDLPVITSWYNNIVSEAFYALNIYRTGGSSVSYHGWAMSDWSYVESDRDADQRISWYIGNCENRGQAGGGKWMKDSNNVWKYCHKGGYCRYFVNLVLYRCSYGLGGGKHLVIPRSGTGYATKSTREARPGWVIQSGMPHTAIVVAVYSGGLDVVDANWVGGNGNFLISRHFMSWSTLDTHGFGAYDPVAGSSRLDQAGDRRRCY